MASDSTLPSKTDAVPRHSVIDFTFNDSNTNSDLNVLCNGKQIHISLSADCFNESPSIQRTYLHYLQVMAAFEFDDLTEEDFYDWVLTPFFPILSQLPPLPEDYQLTLNDYLVPDMVDYTLRGEDDKLIPVLDNEGEARRRCQGAETSLSPEILSTFPSYHPRELRICSENGEGGRSIPPHKVTIDGTSTYFFKAYGREHYTCAPREISNYKAVKDAGFEDGLRIARLHGIVRDGRSNVVFGILLTFVDCNCVTLERAVKPDTTLSVREHWARQVTDTLLRLHERGIVWGDVKPDNILIDRHNNDAWLIDFGGGYTDGWVDKDVAGTVQGDLQGLIRILDFLGINPLDYLPPDVTLQQAQLRQPQEPQLYATAASA
ncbi:uncharacterized protein EI97DRAFT_434489 [Westerdykella ornata]|uniref:Protein kinase domain-containing protein n=1 Tax=Westerdykella ornata TaxID=318751 RepID=A0A6A6JGN8_WESOR|nr:uncharacterized protein EI97DRAFT_434489 [Westerdykella ornata]KAF2275273.1 hypothetical protein EI97DRAFT_434489 [Westerdykella ornata]